MCRAGEGIDKVVLCMQYVVSIERKPSRRKMIIENENLGWVLGMRYLGDLQGSRFPGLSRQD